MANKILFTTTIINLVIFWFVTNFLMINNFKNTLLYYFGYMTSLLNHYFSKKIFIYLDRFTMITIFIVNLYLINKEQYNPDKRYLLYLIYFIMILFYIQSKIIKNEKIERFKEFSFFHGMVHFLATWSLILI